MQCLETFYVLITDFLMLSLSMPAISRSSGTVPCSMNWSGSPKRFIEGM